MGARWGLRPKEVDWLYVAIVRPTVSFASLLWWPGCQTANAKKKLNKVQRLACLGITGAIRTTRNNETYLESSTTNNIYCLNCKNCVTLHNNNNTTCFGFS